MRCPICGKNMTPVEIDETNCHQCPNQNCRWTVADPDPDPDSEPGTSEPETPVK